MPGKEHIDCWQTEQFQTTTFVLLVLLILSAADCFALQYAGLADCFVAFEIVVEITTVGGTLHWSFSLLKEIFHLVVFDDSRRRADDRCLSAAVRAHYFETDSAWCVALVNCILRINFRISRDFIRTWAQNIIQLLVHVSWILVMIFSLCGFSWLVIFRRSACRKDKVF